MRQVYIQIAACCFETLGIKSIREVVGKKARRIFGKFHCEPQFPSDARIMEVAFQQNIDVYSVYIESQAYPDVFAPTKLRLVCHRDNIWEEPEKVTFT
jgi:hypothetical protein